MLLYLVWLTLSGAVIASTFFPVFRELGRYGKLSSNGNGKSHVLTKVAFISYYAWAVLWALVVLISLISFIYVGNAPSRFLKGLCLLDPDPERDFNVYRFHGAVLCLVLYLIHLTRRLLECIFVTRFSGSKQHLLITVAALCYYWLAVVTPALESSVCSVVDLPQGPRAKASFSPLKMLLSLSSAQVLGLFIFAAANALQYQSHRILANLRSPRQNRGIFPAPKYQIPRGGLFEVVSCPHYLAEVLIYLGLFLVAGGTLGQMLVLVWVVTNLTITASRTHRWYKQKFENYPTNRFRIFPGIY